MWKYVCVYVSLCSRVGFGGLAVNQCVCTCVWQLQLWADSVVFPAAFWDANESFLTAPQPVTQRGGGGGRRRRLHCSNVNLQTALLGCHHDITSFCCWPTAQGWRCFLRYSSGSVFAVTPEPIVTRSFSSVQTGRGTPPGDADMLKEFQLCFVHQHPVVSGYTDIVSKTTKQCM